MYAPFAADDGLYQGDVVTGVVTAYLSQSPGDFIRPDLATRVQRRGDEPLEDLIAVASPEPIRTCMIVSQTCDVRAERREFISVALVHPISALRVKGMDFTDARKTAAWLAREYPKQVGIFYLREDPQAGLTSKCYAHLFELHTIWKSPEDMEYLRTHRILRLDAEAVKDLQWRLAAMFGRFAVDDGYYLTDRERAELE